MWRSDTASLGVILGRAKKREKRFWRDDERSKVKKRSRLSSRRDRAFARFQTDGG
jgi:hypothetical protein